MARKKRARGFKPNHAYIDKAIGTYLENGGKITRIEVDQKSYKQFISRSGNLSAVDEFLLG